MINNWQVKSHSYAIADTGDYDGYWEIVNERGDSLQTREDYEGVEDDLQKIADALNAFPGKLSLGTATEINTHCENIELKDHIRAAQSALEKIITMNRQQATDQYGDPELAETWSCVKVAREALKQVEQ